MRTLNLNEITQISGASISKLNLTDIIENTFIGVCIGAMFPGFAPALGLTSIITNPALATGACFGAYTAVKLGAQELDAYMGWSDRSEYTSSISVNATT